MSPRTGIRQPPVFLRPRVALCLTPERGALPETEVTPLRLAEVEFPEFHPEAPGSAEIFAFLVRDGANLVLVDTGVGSGNAIVDRLYDPERVGLSAALATAGASVGQITAIVNSHLHFDHCGNNLLFPGVPIYVQHAEWETAQQRDYSVSEWINFPNANYVIVRGGHSISTHLELLPTPGHSPGHQSLVVRSSAGIDLIVAQAAYSALEFERFLSGRIEVPDGSWSEESYLRSLRTLQEVHPRRAFFSHDATVWELGA